MYGDEYIRGLSDRPDWILLKLRLNDLNRGSLPQPLRIINPEENKESISSQPPILSTGHPWSTSMKVADPTTSLLYPPSIHFLKYSFKHNILVQVGHSGGPVLIRRNDGLQVIGTQSSGQQGPGKGGDKGLTFDETKTPTQISLIPAPLQDYEEKFNNATLSDIWYYLIHDDANINISYQLQPIPRTAGEVRFYLRILSQDGSSATNVLAATQSINAGTGTDTTQCNTRFSLLPLGQNFADLCAAHIRGIIIQWEPTDSTVDSPEREVRCEAPVTPLRKERFPVPQSAILSSLEVSIKGIDSVSRLVLTKQTWPSTNQPNPRAENLDFDFYPVLQLAWKDNASQDFRL